MLRGLVRKKHFRRGKKNLIVCHELRSFCALHFFCTPLYLMPLMHGLSGFEIARLIGSGHLQPFSSLCVLSLYNQGCALLPLTSQKVVSKWFPPPVTRYELLVVSFFGWMTHGDSCRACPDRQGTSSSPRAGPGKNFHRRLCQLFILKVTSKFESGELHPFWGWKLFESRLVYEKVMTSGGYDAQWPSASSALC